MMEILNQSLGVLNQRDFINIFEDIFKAIFTIDVKNEGYFAPEALKLIFNRLKDDFNVQHIINPTDSLFNMTRI